MKRLLFFGTFLSVLLLHQPKTFGQFKLPTPLNLDAIKVTEIFPEGSNQAGEGTIRTTSIAPSLPTPSLTTTVSRTVNNLWQIQIPDSQDISQLKPEYYLESDKGTKDSLSNQINSDEIKVIISPINPLVKVTSDPIKQTQTVQGGATFTLELSGIKSSGSYSGRLRVTITGI